MRILFLFPAMYMKLIDEILQEISNEKMAKIEYEKHKARVDHFQFLCITCPRKK